MRLPMSHVLTSSAIRVAVLLFTFWHPLDGYASDCIIVKGAQIDFGKKPSSDQFQRMIDLANFGHELVPGSGYVLVFRDQTGGSKGIDSERFKKITFSLSGGLAPKVDQTILDGHLSEGSSGFVRGGGFKRSEKFSGTVKLECDAGCFHVTFAYHSSLMNMSPLSSLPSDEVNETIQCDAKVVDYSQIDAWLGKPGGGESFYEAKLLSDSGDH